MLLDVGSDCKHYRYWRTRSSSVASASWRNCLCRRLVPHEEIVEVERVLDIVRCGGRKAGRHLVLEERLEAGLGRLSQRKWELFDAGRSSGVHDECRGYGVAFQYCGFMQ